MATLDSSLEVLAFDYVSIVFNNLWTWIAVLTAAVSLWRIRATTIRRDDSSRDESSRESSKPQAIMETRPHRVKVTGMEDWSPLVCNDGVTKGKLTVYYYGGDFDEDEDERNRTAVSYGDGESEERVVKMRNGDGDWYRYVDLTVINGNVVRLWDTNGGRNGGWVS